MYNGLILTLLYLGKFVYLFHHGSKQSSHTFIYQTLHVVHSLFIGQVQSEFILHLKMEEAEERSADRNQI